MIKWIGLVFLVIGLFIVPANGQCRVDPTVPATQDICNRTAEVRDAVNRAVTSSDATNLKLDRVNEHLSTLINLLTKSNSNTEATSTKLNVTNIALAETSTQIKQQNVTANELLQNLIIERFKSLPADLITDQRFRDEIKKLKDDILKAVAERKP